MKEWKGTIEEDMRGEELSRIIVRQWGACAGSMLYFDELISACKAMKVSSDSVMDFIGAVNDYRGHNFATDVLEHAFVPEENVRAVCDLLDQVQGLCVKM